MHRSGTSVLAHLLSVLGVNMGERFRPPDAHNPDGYFEDLDFRDLNQEILHAARGTWYQPPDPEAIIEALDVLDQQIAVLVARKNQGLWGFKDPRTCLTIPIIAPVLPRRTLYINLTRNREAVVRSLMRRAALRGYYETQRHWEDLYDTYQARTNAFLLRCRQPYLKLDYTRLLFEPRSVVITLCHLLNIPQENAPIEEATALIRLPEAKDE
jgi:hypothetical protein